MLLFYCRNFGNLWNAQWNTGHSLTMKTTASRRRRNSTSWQRSKVRKVGPSWLPSLASYPLLRAKPGSETSICTQSPLSRPFIHTLTRAAEHRCDLSLWIICTLSLRPGACLALSSICPDPFHFLWRLPTPRLQPPEFSVLLYADLSELVPLLTSCSSLTSLSGSWLVELLLLCTYLSSYVWSVGWVCHPLKKTLVNQQHQNIVYSVQYSILLFEKVAGCNYQFHCYLLQTKYYFGYKELNIIF